MTEQPDHHHDKYSQLPFSEEVHWTPEQLEQMTDPIIRDEIRERLNTMQDVLRQYMSGYEKQDLRAEPPPLMKLLGTSPMMIAVYNYVSRKAIIASFSHLIGCLEQAKRGIPE